GHEINNPAAYVSLGVQQMARRLREALGADDPKPAVERVLPILDDVQSGVHRIAAIVAELRLFARQPTTELDGPVDLNGLVRSAASLVQAELKERAQLTLALGPLPPLP